MHTKISHDGGKRNPDGTLKISAFTEIVCSAGDDPYNPAPCAGCSAHAEGDTSISARKIVSFYNVLHLGWYHGLPIVRRNGELVVDDGGAPKIEWIRCSGPVTCNTCKRLAGQPVAEGAFHDRLLRLNPEQILRKFGKTAYLQVGSGHRRNVESIARDLSLTCSRCTMRMTLQKMVCTVCGNVVMDLTTTPMDARAVEDALVRPCQCVHCRQVVMLAPQGQCMTCGPDVPAMNIGDGVLLMRKRGQRKESVIVSDRFLTFPQANDWLTNQGQVDLFGGKNLEQFVAEMTQSFDFPTLLAPKSLEEQHEILFGGGERYNRTQQAPQGPMSPGFQVGPPAATPYTQSTHRGYGPPVRR